MFSEFITRWHASLFDLSVSDADFFLLFKEAYL